MGKWRNDIIEILIRLYVEQDMTIDELIADEDALKSFAGKLNDTLKDVECFSAEEIAKKILNLRKAGKLPRIRR